MISEQGSEGDKEIIPEIGNHIYKVVGKECAQGGL